jgi:hypothetical protein
LPTAAAPCTTCTKAGSVGTTLALASSVGTVTRIAGPATTAPFVTVAGAGRETAFAGLMAAVVGAAVYAVAAL